MDYVMPEGLTGRPVWAFRVRNISPELAEMLGRELARLEYDHAPDEFTRTSADLFAWLRGHGCVYLGDIVTRERAEQAWDILAGKKHNKRKNYRALCRFLVQQGFLLYETYTWPIIDGWQRPSAAR